MKKILFIGLILITLNCYSQNKNIEYGIKGGLNYSNFIDNNDEDIPADYNGKIGFHFGGFISFGITEKISIRPELIFSQQGSNFSISARDLTIFSPNDPGFITSIDGNIKESLLIIPFITEYHLSDKFGLEFGPQFGYSLRRKVEFEDNPLGDDFIRNEDSEKFELGIGLGFEYSMTENLGTYLRYNYGIIERQNLNNSVIQLGVSYKL